MRTRPFHGRFRVLQAVLPKGRELDREVDQVGGSDGRPGAEAFD